MIKKMNYSGIVIVFATGFLMVFTGAGTSAVSTAQAGCTMYKYDLHLTGIAPMKSNIIQPEVKWSYYLGNKVNNPAAGDINSDGNIEIVFGSKNHNVYALNMNGNLLWTFTAESWVIDSPAIGDINGDGANEVVIGDYWWPDGGDSMYALKGNDGGLIWQFSAPQSFESGFQASPLLFDANNDGILDVLVGSYEYHFYALDGPTGTIIWKSERYEHMIKATSPIGDIDNDGNAEVVTVDNHAVTKIRQTNTGTIEWQKRIDYGVDASPVLADLNGDGYLEIIYCLFGYDTPTSRGGIYVLDHLGNYVWTSMVYQYFYTSPTIVDVDSDNLPDVIAGTSDTHTIVAYKGTDGTVLWTNPLVGSEWVGGALIACDIDSDETTEILVPGFPDLYCLSSIDGSIDWRYEVPSGSSISSQPIVADIDHNGRAEIIVGASDGKLYVLYQPVISPNDAALRIAGKKGNTITAEIIGDGKTITSITITRTTGKPNDGFVTFAMIDGHSYSILLTYHSYYGGSNPTWLTINGQEYFYNFNSQKGTIQTITLNL